MTYALKEGDCFLLVPPKKYRYIWAVDERKNKQLNMVIRVLENWQGDENSVARSMVFCKFYNHRTVDRILYGTKWLFKVENPSDIQFINIGNMPQFNESMLEMLSI